MVKSIVVLLFVLVATHAHAFENDFNDVSSEVSDDFAFETVAEEEELEHLSDWVDETQEDLMEVAHEENGIKDTELIESEAFDSEAAVEQVASEQASDDDDDDSDDSDDNDDDEDGTSDSQEVTQSPKGRRGRKPGQLGMNENRNRHRGRKYYKPRKSRSRSSRRSRYSTARPVQPTNEPVENQDRAAESDEVSPVDRSRFERRQRPRSRSRSRSSRSRHDRVNRPDRPCDGEDCTVPPRKSNCTGRMSGRPTGMPHHKKWSTPEGRQSPHHGRPTNQPPNATDADGNPASWWSWWSF